MTITARFPTPCPRCRTWIVKGETVEWTPGSKATHPNCLPATTPAVVRLSVENKGVYVMPDGAIVLVKAAKDTTNPHTYAMRWTVIGGLRVTEAGSFEHAEYVYERGLIDQVSANGRPMSLDEAQAFITRFGVCARCGRGLKAAKSVLAGLGPVCVRYFTAGTTGADLMSATVAAPVAAVVPLPTYTRSRWSRPDDDELESAS